MGHERVSVYESLCLRKVLHRNSKNKLVVEPAHRHTETALNYLPVFNVTKMLTTLKRKTPGVTLSFSPHCSKKMEQFKIRLELY